jgi:CheY-like chemotaxis protein
MKNQDNNFPVESDKKNDFALLSDLIGSAIRFSSLGEYLELMEDRLRSETNWDNIEVLEFNESKECFINHRSPDRCGPALMGFYSSDSPVIKKVRERTGSILRTLKSPAVDSYERKLISDRYTCLCLAPVILEDKFSGVVIGYSKKEGDVPDRDRQLLEVTAEIIASCLERFVLKTSDHDQQKLLQEYREQMINLESLKILGELSAGAAHSLNNLLAGIMGYVQVIELKNSDEMVKSMLDEIKKSVMTGSSMVRNLQEFKRIDLETDMEPIQIDSIVKKSVFLTRSKWQDEAWAKNINYKIEMALKDSVFAVGNETLLLEAFIVILFKCLESIPLGGKVTIEVLQENDSLTVDFTTNRKTSIGEGLLALDPFVHSREKTTLSPNLMVAEEIIRRHNGTLTRDAKIGQGITISVKLPVMERRAAVKTRLLGSREKVSARILVAEDEPVVRSLLTNVLTTEGFIVKAAENGMGALDIMQNDKDFDLMITDLSMPDISGFELADRVRRILPDIPIILATGWEARIDRKKITNHRIDFVVGKPFNFRELVETISKFISSDTPQ